MPRSTSEWDQRYVNNELPWDTNRHDKNLEQALADGAISPGRAFDLGCGTGSNAVWLVQRGFTVTGSDISPTAIERARIRAKNAGVDIAFAVADFLTDDGVAGPFDLVFDRGCFHSFPEPEEQDQFVQRVSDRLDEGGGWISLIGSTDGPDRDEGPPRRSAAWITSTVEPRFEILSLRDTVFDNDQDDPPRAWVCVMRRRGTTSNIQHGISNRSRS